MNNEKLLYCANFLDLKEGDERAKNILAEMQELSKVPSKMSAMVRGSRFKQSHRFHTDSTNTVALCVEWAPQAPLAEENHELFLQHFRTWVRAVSHNNNCDESYAFFSTAGTEAA